jgi:phosphatidylinositol 4-kinase
VVGLIEDDCSCFPTRKRVPYRIIIETIDKKELNRRDPENKFGMREQVQADE